jgi:hypothetical protein
MFNRDLHAVQPFNALQRRRISVKPAANIAVPVETPSPLQRQMSPQMTRQISRQISRQMTRQLSKDREIDEDRSEQQPGAIITALDQLTQTGASFYAPYTDTLSVLSHQNSLLRSMSLN